MEYQKALEIANKWVSELAPFCEKIQIAGSIRRGKPEVKDIEIVCQPKNEPVIDMFGNEIAQFSALESYLSQVQNVRFVKNGEKYKQIRLPEGINLDLFIVTPPAQYGVILAIRTGPAEYSHWLVTPKRQGGGCPSFLKVKEGALHNNGKTLLTPEEKDFFEALGVPWTPPDQRSQGW